jgi:BMFP domain-containing protein YqiC
MTTPELHKEHVEQHAATATVETPKPQDSQKPLENLPPKEQAFEQYKQVDDTRPEESPYVIRQASRKDKTDQVMTDDAGKSPMQVQIENIMASGLEEAYSKMDVKHQEEFRIKGVVVAREIESLTTRLKLTARRVIHLIRNWLKLIPGINKFFLEQATKLKTDEVMKYVREEMQQRRYR